MFSFFCRFPSLRRSRALTATVLAVIATSAATSRATTTTVSAFGDGGWTNGDTRDNTGANGNPPAGRVDLNVTSPATPPSGTNSLRLVTDTTSSKATLQQAGINLGSLADFSATYSWYKENVGDPAPAPSFKIGIDTSDSNPGSSRPGEAAFDKFLIYEPYNNNPSNNGNAQVDTWVTETINQTTGNFWLVDRTDANSQHALPYSQVTLADWESDPTYGARLSGGTIVALQLGEGSGNVNITGYVDTLSYTFGPDATSETYNFGNAVPEPASLGLLGVGALGLLRRRRARC